MLIPLQDKGLTPLAGLLATLALILILSIALSAGERKNLEQEKSFYWHKTPEDWSLFRGGFVHRRYLWSFPRLFASRQYFWSRCQFSEA